ncbi:sirohydrochlorin chelatase [Kitasatospora viridis]|uniref:Sirohydrochlorin ferrochelatase n=1 Tax=Kitasatospora viridis TaxID=281105 RepID=A0A561UKW8_9ACTN|nr:sirohydrochlorin chelatase [Kitasatospora viridis]TWF99995.1 sirohydrochlorin ferrochelatase [Kitasatospora viridis]
MTATLVAVAHGTRDPAGAAALHALIAEVRTQRPGLRVELCFLDHALPRPAELLAELRGTAVLVPLLLGPGFHLRVDLPAAAAAAPHLRIRPAAPLGPDPLLAEALHDRLAEAGEPADAVVLAAAGSTDPAGNAEAARMAGLLTARLDRPVAAGYLCASSPSPAEAVAALRAAGHRRVAVAPYLLAPGFFATRAARSGGALTAAPLGAHPALARLVLERHDRAAAG